MAPALPPPMIIKAPVTSVSITARGSKDPVIVKVTESESTATSTVSYKVIAPTEEARQEPVINLVCMHGIMTVDVVMPGKGIVGWFSPSMIKVEINVELAKGTVLTDFTHDIEVGELEYYGPSQVVNFTVLNGLGKVLIRPVGNLVSQFMKLKCNMGDVSIPESASVAKNVDVKVDVGSCKAYFSDFETLVGITKMGDLNLKLRPSYPVSFTDLKCSTGSIKVDLAGFDGRFELKTTVGSVKVTAPKGITNTNNPCKGIVGDDDAMGVLNIVASMGDVKVDFLE
ncbi:hypothetical protein BDR26DRAFT_853738 [Obelidium mucronatum]|nr:hypothetical protein BDR26DRAFT_853738 [Obelidium mucronatum]